jgi:hypothetical protein
MKPFSRSFPVYALALFAVLAALSAQLPLPGPLRFLPPLFLASAVACSLIAVLLGKPADKAAGAGMLVGLYWMVMTTASLGGAGLFLAATGAWFWLGAPLTIAAGAVSFYLGQE